MRQLVENIVAVSVVLLTEAWFLQGYFSGKSEFEPAIALLLAVSTLLAKDPVREHFNKKQKPRNDHDQALFKEFLTLLPYDPAIRLLSEHDFAGAFRRDDLNPLRDFAWLWESVEKEFVDKELEASRREFHLAVIHFRQELAGRTVPIRNEGFCSVFSDEMRQSGQPRPPEVIEDIRVLNKLAGELAIQYANFVRTCRAKLI